ncbi:MAG: biopolymer transporter ExbD, partial [Kiritimatiellae bacterium]|nr:biopolymer transporter ExbD [Kiritimatiellia bacterium]
MARKPQENPQLDMTPMIDVVFELIIFFVVTIKQEDLFTKLN